jgi:hypothetical protein
MGYAPPVVNTTHASIPRGRLVRASAVIFLLGSALLTSSTGCGASIGSFCEEAVFCEGGNDLDEEACNISLEAEAETADLKNCGAEFDAYLDCITETSRCNDGRYGPNDGNCSVEAEQLEDCAKD